MNAKVAEALNQVALPVVPYDTCKRADYWWFQVKTSMICCGYTLPDELKSVCQVKDSEHKYDENMGKKSHIISITLTKRNTQNIIDVDL